MACATAIDVSPNLQDDFVNLELNNIPMDLEWVC